MKQIKVSVTKYEANDGKIFDSEEECIHYEKMKSGQRKICDSCKGGKTIDPYGDGKTKWKCPMCDGKGWVEKTVVWK